MHRSCFNTRFQHHLIKWLVLFPNAFWKYKFNILNHFLIQFVPILTLISVQHKIEQVLRRGDIGLQIANMSISERFESLPAESVSRSLFYLFQYLQNAHHKFKIALPTTIISYYAVQLFLRFFSCFFFLLYKHKCCLFSLHNLGHTFFL